MTTPQKESIELLAENRFPYHYGADDKINLQINTAMLLRRQDFIAGYSVALEEQKEKAVTSSDIDSYFRKMKIDISKPIPVALVIELIEGFAKSFLSQQKQ